MNTVRLNVLRLLALTVSTVVTPLSNFTIGADESESAPRNHLVRVVTVSQQGLKEKPGKRMLDATMTRMDRAVAFRPDIVCLPETFTRGEPETVPGPTTDRLSDWAKKYRSYVICPMTLQDDDRIFNSAILINRGEKIVGRYDNIRLTEGELEKSICPGVLDPPVFETDFGLVGIQICFDVNRHAQWRTLKRKGAKIIFFASA